VAGALAAVMALPAAGQTVRIDEGTFRIVQGGREVGVETFTIRQNGTGADAVIIAQGRVVLERNGAGEVVANVQFAGTGLRPVAYDMEIRGADARRIQGSVAGRRASARIMAATETFREYLVTEGAVIVDDGFSHHYWFVAQRAAGGASTVPIIVPRESRQVLAQLVAGAEESIAAGGTTVRARRITVQPAGGDVRSVWVDAAGRVLRVEVPAREFVAVRTTLP
jgi:hypothetical protein